MALGWRFCEKDGLAIPQLAKVALSQDGRKSLEGLLQSLSSPDRHFFIRLGLKPSTIPWIKRLPYQGTWTTYRLPASLQISLWDI